MNSRLLQMSSMQSMQEFFQRLELEAILSCARSVMVDAMPGVIATHVQHMSKDKVVHFILSGWGRKLMKNDKIYKQQFRCVFM